MEIIKSIITPGFSKDERSGFKYWLAHYCAFNMTALNLGCWKPKYLLHDIEKPWLKLFLRDYKKVQKYHRKHSKHHILAYSKAHGGNYDKCDFEAAVIDWECSRYTKQQAPLTAVEEFDQQLKKIKDKLGTEYTEHDLEVFREKIPPILEKFGLNKSY